jgi:hypothetical protein
MLDLASKKWTDLSIYTDIFSPATEEEEEELGSCSTMALSASIEESEAIQVPIPNIYEEPMYLMEEEYCEPSSTVESEIYPVRKDPGAKRRPSQTQTHRVSMKPVSAATLSVLKLNLLKKKCLKPEDEQEEVEVPEKTSLNKALKCKKKSKASKSKKRNDNSTLKSSDLMSISPLDYATSVEPRDITKQLMSTFSISEDQLYSFNTCYHDSNLVFSDETERSFGISVDEMLE